VRYLLEHEASMREHTLLCQLIQKDLPGLYAWYWCRDNCGVVAECQSADKSADKTPKALALNAEKIRIANLDNLGH
jgi:hypothetical protein